jgi:predicted cupin superfamily sugar epimerase
MDPRISQLIDRYDLRPLPVEGTLFVGTYRSAAETPDGGPVGTAMIGLYSEDPPSWSTFHRLPADEIWHFYDGDPLRLILLAPDGSSRDVVMGRDGAAGQVVQAVVPAGTWQAGHLVEGGTYSLFGCTMAPGFTSAGFEGATVDTLLARFPDRAVEIRRLAPTDGVTTMPTDLAT